MKKLTATHKGIITGLAMIVASVIFFYVLKFPENGTNQLLVWLIYISGIIWSLASYKMADHGSASFKDYFSEGFKTFIVVTLFMAVFTFVFYKLNPQILEETIKTNNIIVQKEGDHTPAEIEENAKRLRNIFMPMMLATKTLMNLFIGALISIIGGIILRSRKSAAM